MNEELFFQPSESGNMNCTVVVITNDSLVEESEAFYVSLSSNDDRVSPAEHSLITVTIIDSSRKLIIMYYFYI